MSDVSGIPNLGIPGMNFSGGVLGGNAATGQPAMSADQINASMWGRISPQQLQAVQNNIYGPLGFGGQTALSAATGAAYGRGTGGFGGLGAANADPFTPVSSGGGGGLRAGSPARVDVASSPFDTGNAGAVPYLSGGGLPFGGGGFGRMPTVFDTGAKGIDISGGGAPFGGGGFSPGQQPAASGPMDFNRLWSSRGVPGLITNNYFNDITAQPAKPPSFGSGPAGGRSFIEPDLASQTGQLAMPSSQRLRGYDPAQSAAFAPGGGDTFQSRFGMGFRGAGTPSQYTTEPYTDAQGQTHGPNIPGGFQTPFSVDNPGGALPASRGSPFPIMGAGGEPSQDTLTAGDRGIRASFGAGASPVPYPSAGGQAFPGAGIGSLQGGMRDRIAAAMSGAGGNTPPPTVPGTGGPMAPPTPTPTPPQMNNAQDMLRQGRGWTIAQQTPPPQSGYAPINQAISAIGSVSRPGMFDNLNQPLGQMFSPAQYGGGLRR